MLFDLRGRRRRAVQVTYVTLAVLMGGGLILFGIGGSVSGGLLDAFKSGNGNSSSTNSIVAKSNDNLRKKLARDPNNASLLAQLARGEFQAATAQIPSGASSFPKDARDELARSSGYWKRYVAVSKGKVNADLARVAVQVYAPTALNKPSDAANAARIVARADNDASSYLQLVQYASLAGDKRTADLAAQKALDLAPKSQRKAVKEQIKQLQSPQPAATQPPQG
jgi:hypothetical protein